VLRIVLPKGSLEAATLELFAQADLTIVRSSDVEYKATIDDPRVDDVHILRPQEIPDYVAEGLYDVGVAGRDCIEEAGREVVSLGVLQYSKATSRPFRIVLAVPEASPWQAVRDLPDGVRVSTEFPKLTTRFLEKHGVVDPVVRYSFGATEAKIPDIADAIVDGTETGRALRAAKLRILDTVVESYTELIANPVAYADPTRRHAMEQLLTLLMGTLEARGKVLVKLNVSEADLDQVVGIIPSMKSPTVSKLFGDGGYAVETVVAKSEINTLIPALKDAGASDIIELPLAKIVH
jgi:ATP phosphoribosyltransferase